MEVTRSPGAIDAGRASPSVTAQPSGREAWMDSPLTGLSSVFSKKTPTWALPPGVKVVIRERLSG